MPVALSIGNLFPQSSGGHWEKIADSQYVHGAEVVVPMLNLSVSVSGTRKRAGEDCSSAYKNPEKPKFPGECKR